MSHNELQVENKHNGNGAASAPRNEMNILSLPVDSGSAVASTTDSVFIEAARKVPAARTKNPSKGTAGAITPPMVSVLKSPAVTGYYGTRVDLEQMVDRHERYAAFTALQTRFENSAAIAAQLGAPDGAYVEEQLSKFMSNWEDFEEQLPKEALALQALRDYWTAAHPGRSPVKKGRGAKDVEAPTEEAPAAKAAVAAPEAKKE
jgi:hypothetical protein